MSNMTDLWLSGVFFFQTLNTPKPAEAAYDTPPNPLVSSAGEGDTPYSSLLQCQNAQHHRQIDVSIKWKALILTAVLSRMAQISSSILCSISLSLASTMTQLSDNILATVRWNACSCVASHSAAWRSRSSRLLRASIQPAWLASSLCFSSSTSRSSSCCLANELSRS